MSSELALVRDLTVLPSSVTSIVALYYQNRNYRLHQAFANCFPLL